MSSNLSLISNGSAEEVLSRPETLLDPCLHLSACLLSNKPIPQNLLAPASPSSPDPPPLLALKAIAQSVKSNASTQLISLGKSIADPIWSQRCFFSAAWLTAREGDYRLALSLCQSGCERFSQGEAKLASLIASSRLRMEIGDIQGALRNLEEYSSAAATTGAVVANDVRYNLAVARCLFAQGQLQQSKLKWLEVLSLPPSPPLFPVEDESSAIASIALAAVVGDLGCQIEPGSRACKLEAGNNYAIACLQLGVPDEAIQSLSSLFDDHAPNGVIVSNIKTLYDLARTPENSRLLLPPASSLLIN